LDKPISLKSARTLQITYNLPISRTSKFWQGLKEGKIYEALWKGVEQLAGILEQALPMPEEKPPEKKPVIEIIFNFCAFTFLLL